MYNYNLPEKFQYIITFYNNYYPNFDSHKRDKSEFVDLLYKYHDEIFNQISLKINDFQNNTELQTSIQKMKLDSDSVFVLVAIIYFHIELTEYTANKYREIEKERQKKKYRELRTKTLGAELKRTIDNQSDSNLIGLFKNFTDIPNKFSINNKTNVEISKLRQESISISTFTSRLKQFMIIKNLELGIPEFIKPSNVKYTTIEREFYLRILIFARYINFNPEKNDLIIDFGGSFNSLMRDFDEIESSLTRFDNSTLLEFLKIKKI